MKKPIAVLLVFFILGSFISSSLAQDYHRKVLEHLAGQLQVAEEDIHLEGSLMELEFSGEQLWAGRYILGEDGGTAGSDLIIKQPGVSGSHAYHDTGNPADANDSVSSDPAAGAVYLRIKTGEILTGEEGRLLLEEERKLKQQELERLRKESGRISPYLYRRLINVPPEQKFRLTIWPKYKETAAMQAAMKEVYREYPEFSAGEVSSPSGRTEPGGAGAGDSGGGTEPYPLPADDVTGGIEPGYAGDSAEFSILPYLEEKEEADERPGKAPPALPEEAPPDMIDREKVDWSRFEEMQQKLDEIRMQGYQESMIRLAGELESMNVNYETLGGGVAVNCEMTAGQALSLKDKEYIESIGEEIAVTADGRELAPARDLMSAAGENAAETKKPALWMLVTALLLLAGAGGYAIFCRKRKAVKEQ